MLSQSPVSRTAYKHFHCCVTAHWNPLLRFLDCWRVHTAYWLARQTGNCLIATLATDLLSGVTYLIQKPTHRWVPLPESDDHHCKVLFCCLYKIKSVKQMAQHIYNAHIELWEHGIALQRQVLISPNSITNTHPDCFWASSFAPIIEVQTWYL
jgi:hypothetical protein